MTPQSPIVFRLYTERFTSLFVRAQVWPTKKTFLAHMNAHHFGRNGGGFYGRCQGACSRHESYRFRKGQSRRKSPCVADVNLWRGKLTMEVVTHELFHATIAWGHRVGFDFAGLSTASGVTATEERISYVHGRICREFVGRAIAAGLYADGNSNRADAL